MISLIIAFGIIIGCLASLWLLENWYKRKRIDIQNQYRKEYMKLYLFTRSNDIDYDQCIGGVVAASSSIRAEEIMNDLCLNDEQWEFTLMAKNAESQIQEGVILSSHNPG